MVLVALSAARPRGFHAKWKALGVPPSRRPLAMSSTNPVAPRASRAGAPASAQPRARSAWDLLFSPPTAGSRGTDLGLLFLRVIGGLALALGHGLGKLPPSEGFTGRVGDMGFPAPELFAWLATTAEFGGGLLLALGLLTRPAALLVCGQMVVVALLAHAGDPFGDREKAVLIGAIALMCLLAGSGRYSLDALFRRRG
jgi:putative oxidoreductase